MTTERFIAYVAVMAAVTYLVRAVPLVAMRKKLGGGFLRSFLYYVPFAVLAAMTVPDIFYSTSSALSAAIGFAAAVALALSDRGLVTVALAACAAVFIAERFL